MKTIEKNPHARLTDFVGKEVTLAEKPNGYCSSDYPVEVGKKYRVLYVDGSTLCVELPDSDIGTAHIYYGCFKEFQQPVTP